MSHFRQIRQARPASIHLNPPLQRPARSATGTFNVGGNPHMAYALRVGGFSLHAGIDIQPGQRQKLERLCRYVSRPPVALERMALTSSGHVRYTLKTPYRDGTTQIVLPPGVRPGYRQGD